MFENIFDEIYFLQINFFQTNLLKKLIRIFHMTERNFLSVLLQKILAYLPSQTVQTKKKKKNTT